MLVRADPGVVLLRALFQVSACAEGPASRAGEDNREYAVIVCGVLEGPSASRTQLTAQSVHPLRAVQGYPGDSIALLVMMVSDLVTSNPLVVISPPS